jgi:hypothetical protein
VHARERGAPWRERGDREVEADNAAAKPEITRKRINGLAKQSATGLSTVSWSLRPCGMCAWGVGVSAASGCDGVGAAHCTIPCSVCLSLNVIAVAGVWPYH